MSTRKSWLEAQNLFALALQAREQGDEELARQLEVHAMQVLEGAQILDEPNGAADLPAVPQPQQRQQQQQAEPNGDDSKEE
jgi:hypothetical protein